MKALLKHSVRTLLALVIGLALLACNDPEVEQKSLDPVAFNDRDEFRV